MLSFAAGPRFAAAGRLIRLLVCLSVCLPAVGDAAIFRVGDGAGCAGTTLAAALLGAALNGSEADSIYMTVTPSQTVSSEVSLPLDGVGNIEIVGGFANCTDALPGSGQTPMSLPSSNGFVVQGGAASTRFFTLANVAWVATPGAGRPLDLSGRVVATVDNVLLSRGSGASGGNLRMTGNHVALTIGGGSRIYLGEATDGGGIHCSGGGAIGIDTGAKVIKNHAVHGGGVYLDGCTLNLYTGSAKDVSCGSGLDMEGVACNAADASGGGVTAVNGAHVGIYGTASEPASIEGNQALEGGGLYLSGAGTWAIATNAEIRDNAGLHEGGGAFVRAGAELTMGADASGCARGVRCSLLEDNQSGVAGGLGGGIAVDSGGFARIARTTMTGNHAQAAGSVVFVEDNGSAVELEGVISFGNTGSLNQAFFRSEDLAGMRVAFSTLDEATGCCKGLFDTGNNSRVEVFSSVLLGRVFSEAGTGAEVRFVDCVLVGETASLPGGMQGVELIGSASALFAGYGAGDYRLRQGSQAIDFCDTSEYVPVGGDIELQGRGYDVTSVPNTPFGPYDLGADEWRPLFVCGFEPATSCDAIGDWSAHSP